MRYSTGRFEKAFPSSYTSPLPEPRVRGRNPSNVADDGTTGKYATHAEKSRAKFVNGRAGAAALDGSIALIGARYTLILKAVNCVNGELLSATEAQANDKSHVLDALGKAASECEGDLESL